MIDSFIILAYLICILILGIYSSRNMKTMREYSIADKQYSIPILVSTIFATTIGGGSTIGLTEKVFSTGIIFVLVFLGDPINKLIIAKLVAPRIDQFKKEISLGDIMYTFYGKVGKVVTGASSVLLSVGYVGVQVSAIGYLFNFFLNIPQIWGIILGSAIVVLYSSFGGIKAVTITDVLQFSVLMVSIPIVCNIGLVKIGGYNELFYNIPEKNITLFPNDENIIKYLGYFIIFIIPFMDPTIMQRLLMAKTSKIAVRSMTISALVAFPFFVTIGLVGLLALYLNPDIPSKDAFPYLINNLLPIGVRGLVVSGMLAVTMSTADSYLNVASVGFIHDFVKPLINRQLPDKVELLLSRIFTIVIGCFTVIVSIKFESILDIIFYFYNFWAPIIVVPLLAGIFGFKTRVKTFLVSIICGIVTVILWKIFVEHNIGVDSLIPGLFASFIGFVCAYDFQSIKRSRDIKNSTNKKRTSLLYNKLKKFINKFNIKRLPSFNLIDYSKTSVEIYGAQYTSFGVFAVLNYILPYFMWSDINANNQIALSLRIISGILCAILIMRDYLPSKFNDRYLPLYWHITLLFCLPFLTTYMVLEDSISNVWLINMSLGIFLLAFLVGWLSFIILLFIGIILGSCLYMLTEPNAFDIFSNNNVFLLVYMFVFSTMISLIFSRNREIYQQAKLNAMNVLSGFIAHELRTPLRIIDSNVNGITKYLPDLVHGYNIAEQEGFAVKKVKKDHVNLLTRSVKCIKDEIKMSFTVIEMLLMKLKYGKLAISEQKEISIKYAVEEAIKHYPFSEEEKKKIIWSSENNFYFYGDLLLIKHVLFNLLKNSLYHIKNLEKEAKIYISFKSFNTENILYFKDTGAGISSKNLPHIFDYFWTRTNYGTGLGLNFCKSVMKKFGGDLICNSKEGEFTEFILKFPKINNFDREAS